MYDFALPGFFSRTKFHISVFCCVGQEISYKDSFTGEGRVSALKVERGRSRGGLWWREVLFLAGYPNVNKPRPGLSSLD